VPAISASLETVPLFSSVGFVKSDLRGSLLDTTLIDVMWSKQAPSKLNLKRSKGKATTTLTHANPYIHTLSLVSLAHANIQSVACALTAPHTLPKLTDYQPTIHQHRLSKALDSCR
jgi:hypothetical protein